MLSASAMPQKSYTSQTSSNARTSFERDGLAPPRVSTDTGRSMAASAVSFAPRGSSLNPSPAPGAFSVDLRSQMPPRANSRADVMAMEKVDEDDVSVAEQRLAALRDALNREMKIKEGSENMLDALNPKKAKQTKEQRQRVEAELNSANQKIRELRKVISDTQRTLILPPATPTRTRTAESIFQGNSGVRSPPSASRSGAGSDFDEPTESPTFALAEILQALEVDGMMPEYYVTRANSLVDLFKRYPQLKYDLVWSVFGLRMQVLLLSESREVVAAGYRMIRYAISDVASLKKIRALNTDYCVTWSLVKDSKSDVEREQALKFVRAFIDVKDGIRELSRAVVRTIASVAEAPDGERLYEDRPLSEDRLRPMCLETLAEILVRDPRLLVSSGGIGPLLTALATGYYKASDSLTSALLYLLDAPKRRKYLRAGYDLDVLFAPFTDVVGSTKQALEQNAKAITTAMKSWSGLMTLAMFDFRAIRSLVSSLSIPDESIRDTVIELICSLLRIKLPSWAGPFLAGRRLTTYGRVANLETSRTKPQHTDVEDDGGEQNFVEHYTALLLAVFVKCGLVPSLLRLTKETSNEPLERKSTLVIGEVLKLASRLLPPSWSTELQLLPELFAAAANMKDDAHNVASAVVYQISRVSRALFLSSPSAFAPSTVANHSIELGSIDDQPRQNASANYDEARFRQLVLESGVLASSNYIKWKWDIVLKVIEGPLTNGKRMDEATKTSKFLKRIMSFYRPFKYRFSEVKSSRNSQKYVRVGCALMHTFVQTAEGTRYLWNHKLVRQIAECLAQCDPTSGLTAQFPMFSSDRLTETLCGGYFPMLGVLSADPRGQMMLERWRIYNMLYHIVDLNQRPDIVKLALTNFDFALIGHPRGLISKALNSGQKDIRIHATDVLRKYAMRPNPLPNEQGSIDSRWAIQMLVSQLYDPDVEVCAAAVKILEKACNTKSYLEYIVECRPALDHLGEIGAPLLLRFLSTSIGYHYLDGLDYISNEMDDWFLGRNDAYVSVIEASLARSFGEQTADHTNRLSIFEDEREVEADSHVPPHFYRELTRTEEGCKLLRDKGHFDEFVATIRDHGMESEDAETIVKVKGCLWAVGNVGAMELGAPFLESCDVVDQIVRIAQEHAVLSMRGTAFFVLGLISRSVHGLEILSEHGWDSNTNFVGSSLGFCIPTDLGKFFSLRPWKHEAITSIQLPETQTTENIVIPAVPARPRSESLMRILEAENGGKPLPRANLDPDPVNQRILETVVDLSNNMLTNRARKQLMQMKDAPGFHQTHVFRSVVAIMEQHHYHRVDRAMVIELFDKSVLRYIVFGEDIQTPVEVEMDDSEEDEDDESDEEDSSGMSNGPSGRGALAILRSCILRVEGSHEG
ncbi:Rapamycin-insensitive companion of mTOR, N-term-domain-containing protein [Coniochaeta sp. 2T2.1]|nr:Rapamycin-insensitive companion of mTOR, N-term-domain-containing protein [Coniochaeta sp. 2T2.1]